MTVSVKKWGNSLALRIPKDIAHTMHIENDTVLELHIEKGAIVLKPSRNSLLEELVSRIDTQNLHTEVQTGESVGNEEW